jgi:hypothetical protein
MSCLAQQCWKNLVFRQKCSSRSGRAAQMAAFEWSAEQCRSTSLCPHRPPVVPYHFVTVMKMNSLWGFGRRKWSPDKGGGGLLQLYRIAMRWEWADWGLGRGLATPHNMPAYHGMLHRTAWDFKQIRGSYNTHGSDREGTQHSILKPNASRSLGKPAHRLKDNIVTYMGYVANK